MTIMKNKTLLLLILNLFIFIGLFVVVLNKQVKINSIKEPEVVLPLKVDITNESPSYLNYDNLVSQLNKWNEEAPELTEVGVYGQSSKGKDLVYIRLNNKRIKSEKPKVLITACIHGNEPWSTATTMWYIGNLLKSYSQDNQTKELLDSRDIYFVPVVSPDSYPKSRIVDGVDPNRDFPGLSNPEHKSVKPVAALQDLFLKIRPQAVMSGHTWGRVYLMPYGDVAQNCPDHDEYKKILTEMSSLSGYKNIRACDLYMGNGRPNVPPIRVYGLPQKGYNVLMPIYGTEVDWYYRNGAFAVVVEFGTHQKIPTDQDIKTEFDKTYKAMRYFLAHAPLLEMHPNNAVLKTGVDDYKIDFRDE